VTVADIPPAVADRRYKQKKCRRFAPAAFLASVCELQIS
jgi:hypothetical protein